MAAQYTALPQKAAENPTSFTDFIQELLMAERESRRARAREMFARIARFPAVKTLDQYDFSFATGAPRKQIVELASLAFLERAEDVVFSGSGVGRTHLGIALGERGDFAIGNGVRGGICFARRYVALERGAFTVQKD